MLLMQSPMRTWLLRSSRDELELMVTIYIELWKHQEIDIIQEETRLVVVVNKVNLLIYRVGGAGLQNFSVSFGGKLTINIMKNILINAMR